MKWIVASVDGDGRACVVGQGHLDSMEPDAVWAKVFQTRQSPPLLSWGGAAQVLDAAVPPGLARWAIVPMQPGARTPMHRTDTVDFDVVLSGTLELELDDGVHQLEAGDCVVMNGVDHGWAAGPDGCVMAALMLGAVRGDTAS